MHTHGARVNPHGAFRPSRCRRPPLTGYIEGQAKVRVVSELTIRRAAAATSIQAAWRAYACLATLKPPLQLRLRRARGPVQLFL